MRTHRSLCVPAALALSFALAPPAFAGPTVKKRAWSTTVLKLNARSIAPWAPGHAEETLPTFTCPAGESYRLMSMVVVPSYASWVGKTGLQALAELGSWRAGIGIGLPGGPLRENAEIAAAGEGARTVEVRVDAGVDLLPLAAGGPHVLAVETARTGLTNAIFHVFLSGACGTPGEVVESPWRPM